MANDTRPGESAARNLLLWLVLAVFFAMLGLSTLPPLFQMIAG